MGMRHGYKNSEVGIIPDDWEVARLGTLIRSTEYGSSYPSKPRGAVPVLRMGNLQGGRIDWSDLVFTDNELEIQRYELRRGDVLFNRTNTIELVGKTSIYEGEHRAIFAGYLIRVVTLPDRLDPRFLAYVMNTPVARRHGMQVLSVAVGQANINAEKLKTYPIPNPPSVEEQRAIATALSDVDALLDGLDRLIAKKRDLKQATMQQLLTGQTRLPGFSGEWEVKRLGDYVTFLRNGVNSRAELLLEGRVKYLHYGDIHASMDAFLSPHTLPGLPDAKAARLDRLRDGDVIFADASEDIAGVCKSVELRDAGDTEAVSGLHTIAARFDKTVLADGFKGFLQHSPSFATHLRRLAAGTKVYATNRAHIASVEMRLPSVAEQTAIAAVLSDMDAELAALEARRDKTRALKQGMMQELLTGRTRLVPTGGAHV